jgi:hypothetical protein
LGSGAPNRAAARLSYQQNFPHYPLVKGKGDVPIYQVRIFRKIIKLKSKRRQVFGDILG